MPGGDGTGPTGAGAMTGRGAGLCAGNNVPGYTTAAGGWGAGMRCGAGRGFGRNRRRGFMPAPVINTGWQNAPQPTLARQISALKSQAQNLEDALSIIRGQLNELEKSEA